jgi:hypothetical protein
MLTYTTPMPITSHQLSKSTFVKGRQCVKALYLHRHHPDLREETTVERQAVYDRGHMVGTLAQQLFPNGIDVTPLDKYGFADAAERTKQLIASGQGVIYEATFIHDEVLVMVDILARREGQWEAFEVKSTNSLQDTHVVDAALQYHVITGTGLPLADMSIVHLNREYVRMGELDIKQLFVVTSVLDQLLEMQDQNAADIERLKQILALDKIPEVDIGVHCHAPYECDFVTHCWKHVPEPSVFDIAGLHMKRKVELYRNGIIRFEDITEEAELTAHQQLQVKCQLQGTERIDHDGLKEFVNSLTYPLYFLDFESFNPPVPLYDHSRPYQQIAFQYSLHYKSAPNTELRHVEFLAQPSTDPRPEFVRTLLEYTRKPGTILVYSEAFEISILRKLARDFPEYAGQLQERINRIRDLSDPFSARLWYHPRMVGRYSIKFVLPAVVPEMTYNDLEIADGTAASQAFASMTTNPDLDHSQLRNHLLEYCRLDTLAMVRVLEKMETEIDAKHTPQI